MRSRTTLHQANRWTRRAPTRSKAGLRNGYRKLMDATSTWLGFRWREYARCWRRPDTQSRTRRQIGRGVEAGIQRWKCVESDPFENKREKRLTGVRRLATKMDCCPEHSILLLLGLCRGNLAVFYGALEILDAFAETFAE